MEMKIIRKGRKQRIVNSLSPTDNPFEVISVLGKQTEFFEWFHSPLNYYVTTETFHSNEKVALYEDSTERAEVAKYEELRIKESAARIYLTVECRYDPAPDEIGDDDYDDSDEN